MGMMIDVLSKKIRDMKDLRQREERRDNKAAQDTLDLRFKNLTMQIHSLMTALQYTKENMQFQLSEAMLSDLEKLLTEHKGTVRSGFAEKETITQVEADYKVVLQNVKKEWTKQYAVLTNSTVSTLQVIIGIDSEQVSKCLNGISKGSVWNGNIDNFKIMKKNLAEAKTLIDGLGLDQQIIAFLQKMNAGKATVLDLEDNVLRWLKDEALDKRVKLSFAGVRKKY